MAEPLNERLRIVVDLDRTICGPKPAEGSYADCEPNLPLIEKLREYRAQGYAIIVFSSRNMRSYQNNVGLINANTLPVIIEWLRRHEVPFDEVHIGKPWCGFEGFYVDDRAIRPSEFLAMSEHEIRDLMERESGGSD